eukprot:383871_1
MLICFHQQIYIDLNMNVVNTPLYQMLQTLKQSYAPNTPPSEGYKLVYDVTYVGSPNFNTHSGFQIVMDYDAHAFVHGVIYPYLEEIIFWIIFWVINNISSK